MSATSTTATDRIDRLEPPQETNAVYVFENCAISRDDDDVGRIRYADRTVFVGRQPVENWQAIAALARYEAALWRVYRRLGEEVADGC